MMKNMKVMIIVVACYAMSCSYGAVYTSATSGNWTNTAVWGGTHYPGDAATSDTGQINTSTHTVTLNSILPNAVSKIYVNRGALNVAAGSDVTVSSLLTVGNLAASTSATLTQSGGSVRIGNGYVKIGMVSSAAGSSTYYMQSGVLTNTASNYGTLQIGQLDTSKIASFEMSGGSVALRTIDLYNGTLKISGGRFQTTFAGENVTMDAASGLNASLVLSGNSADISFASGFDAYNTGGTGTLRYELGASGISALNVAGAMTLHSSGSDSVLVVDGTAWDRKSGLHNGNALVLADYGTLSGTFASVVLTNITGTVNYAYDLGEGNLGIALVVPEPRSIGLFVLSSATVFLLRRTKMMKN